ncbi:MAG TPA: glycosyltransferase family 1 protein [Caulobacteraceae bacterium]|nr:glycosyltransferase family 1 protein [Caulobacteraceae bacterium]
MTTVLFDATRLLLRAPRGAPTGIDRVALAYAHWLTARTDIDLKPVWGVGGALTQMSRQRFAQLLAAAMPYGATGEANEAPSPAWPKLVAALQAPDDRSVLRSQPSAGPDLKAALWFGGLALRTPMLLAAAKTSAGAVYLNVSHFGLEQPGLLARLARAGVRPVVMIHDLIPIRWPEYCAPGAAARHARRIEGALRHGRLIIANSRATADDLAAYAAATGLPLPELCIAPLGLSAPFHGRPTPLSTPRPYFLAIGTIEPRKNLAFLLTLWNRLAERLGAAAPRLVVVGRRGWENEAVLDLLERAPGVRRLVHEVADLRDSELAQLVAGASALLAPSLAEGFDLASLEALALGTPVIASDIAAHRELATGARLVDPLDGPGWARAIEASLQARPTPAPFSAPTWEQHFTLVGPALDRCAG